MVQHCKEIQNFLEIKNPARVFPLLRDLSNTARFKGENLLEKAKLPLDLAVL